MTFELWATVLLLLHGYSMFFMVFSLKCQNATQLQLLARASSFELNYVLTSVRTSGTEPVHTKGTLSFIGSKDYYNNNPKTVISNLFKFTKA